MTNKLLTSPMGGREMLSKLNQELLQTLYGDRLSVVELEKKPVRGIASIVRAFQGYIDGLDMETCSKIINIIVTREVNMVFVDGSNLGQLTRLLVSRFSEIEVIVFFHNVEARFFWGSFKRFKSMHALVVLAINYLAERKAARYAQKIICLSSRDSRQLLALYGRGATHISAIAVQDSLPQPSSESVTLADDAYMLFVGGGFYANRDGIAWFIDNVVPNISMRTIVVGQGLDSMKVRLEKNNNVTVVGPVDSLVDWYRNALVVVAPIFDGSGMKTKVAEALMHGKKVVGTPEAFSGYESVVDEAGWVCTTPQEFIEVIESLRESRPSFKHELRFLYEQNYSFDAARARFAEILETKIR